MIRYFIDMDGVLCKWDSNASVEETFSAGYFLNREPDEKIINLIKDLRDDGKSVSILSSVYENGICAAEKAIWLSKNGLGKIPQIFVPYGQRKEDYVNKEDFNVLLDDFTDNLLSYGYGELKKSGGEIKRAIVAISEYAYATANR